MDRSGEKPLHYSLYVRFRKKQGIFYNKIIYNPAIESQIAGSFNKREKSS